MVSLRFYCLVTITIYYWSLLSSCTLLLPGRFPLHLLSFLFIYHVQIIYIYQLLFELPSWNMVYYLYTAMMKKSPLTITTNTCWYFSFAISIRWAIVLLAKARLYNFSSFWCHVILLWARAVEVYRWLPDPEILKPSLIALLFLFSWKILVSSVLVRFLKFSWFLCCPRQNWHIS